MDGAGRLDVRGGADCAEWRHAWRGWCFAEGRLAGGGVADDRSVLDFVQQEVDGTAFAHRRYGVWNRSGDADVDGVGSAAVWDAAGGGGFAEGWAGAGGKRCALHGDDDAAVELGDDAGSGIAGGSAIEYGAAHGKRS